jgi:site-specific DNA-methyltransferase (adenine-specific)
MELKDLVKEAYYYDKSGMLLYGDCLDWMPKIPDESVDLVCTDPAYPVISGGRSDRHIGSITEKNDGKIFEYNNVDPEKWIPEVYRILKNNTQCYIMTNILNLYKFLAITEKSGFKLHNLLIWEKQNCTPNRWYMKNCEYILFLRKGRAKQIKNMGSKTVHCFNNPFGNKLHPTEKPVELMQFYIENSSNPKDIVVDPFLGAGATSIACKTSNRKWIGIEIDSKYCEISKKRIQECA